jgi:transmembrane sensor
MTKESFIKYLHGNCTEQEFDQFLAWIKEESLTDSGKRLVQEVWEEFEPEARPVERLKYNRLLDKIHHQININQNEDRPVIRRFPGRNHILSAITRAAAILLLPVLSFLIYTIHSDKIRYGDNINDLEVQAPAGFRMNIELGDGTQVWLNHGSKLKYPYRFTSTSRKVFLTGEAYFKVAHNKKVPFIVETNNIEVKATGTTFNVSAYPGDIVTTTLVEGTVILYDKSRHHEIKTLSPSECLKFNPEKNKYTLETGDIIEKYTGWKDGLLIFKNDSIADIARKLEQWYGVDVKIKDNRVKEFTYTATFYDETLSQVLELMSLPSPVSYKLTPLKKLADGTFSRQDVIIALKR